MSLFEKLLDTKAAEALRAVRAVVDPLWNVELQHWETPTADRRLTWALSKKAAGFVVSILVEQEDTWATRQAKDLERRFPDVIVWTSTGEAQSSYPDSVHSPHAVSGEIRPGVSIGHGRFRAGTLGCIVTARGRNRDQVGVLTAAHVVALNESVEKGDKIYSPGKPDIKFLVIDHLLGKLDNYVDLIPVINYQESEPGEDIFQSIDIAFVRISDTDKDIPKWNEVPDPSDPTKKMLRMREVVPETEIPDLLTHEVYKFGRTTGFTRGKLVYHHIAHRVLKLPNNKLYLYTELLGIVPSKPEQPFSAPGDSGAPVYTEDGRLLGFVIGADTSISLCCIAERALEAMNAELVVGSRRGS